tara:strand:- start:7260 stop:7844 length:585 start_codon:yes stop_codon:yes gene_type:complete
MKNIILEYENASNFLLKSKSIVWNFYINKVFKFILVLFGVLGVFLLYTGIKSGYDIESISFGNDKEDIVLYNYNITIGIGIALILFALFLFNSFYQLKKRTSELFNKRIRSYKKAKNKFVYQINETGISCENHDSKKFHNWEYYSNFKMKNEFIFVFSKFLDPRIPWEIIPLKTLSEEQKKELIDLLKKKLTEK